MPYVTNPHVERLNDFLPLDAGSSTLFQEYVDPVDHPSVPTRALAYLEQAVETAAAELRLLVLTGDAGHGKTYLCAKLLESTGYKTLEAQEALATKCDGKVDIAELPTGRTLRIVKDLSEFTVEEGAESLTHALASDRSLTIVCANEGRLRSAMAVDKDTLAPVAACLDEGVVNGRLDIDPRVRVINLNFQSVASADDPIVRDLIRWAIDGRRWRRACAGCDAQPACPILENQRLLADKAHGATRIGAIELLLQTAERIGAVITVRELLMLVAYGLTGGIRCSDVHRRARRSDWQYAYHFSQNLFGDRLAPSERRSLRSMRHLRLIDPGAVSVRTVDDSLTADEEQDRGRFLPPEAQGEDSPVTTRAQAKSAAEATQALFRFMRRRDFFAPRTKAVPALRRLGFTFGDEFLAIVRGDLEPARFRRCRDQLIAGLEAIQGLRRPGHGRNLLLVDPAFGAGGSGTSIIARHIPITNVDVRSQSSSWQRRLGRAPDLPRALNWSDRTVVIELLDHGEVHPLHVDLLTFEYLMRAGEGLDGRIFFDAEVRRIAGALAPLIHGSDGGDEIQIVRDGRLEGLVIDTGSVIRKVVD